MYKLPKENQMTKQEDQIQLLKLSIKELRRMYDKVWEIYSNVRIKIITFTGGGLAFLSYLYGDGESFFPKEPYGRALYLIGLALFIWALSILLLATQPVRVRLPTESKKHKNHNNYLKFLEYVRKEYVEAIGINLSYSEEKHKKSDLGASLLLIGAILLLVIKYFKGGL